MKMKNFNLSLIFFIFLSTSIGAHPKTYAKLHGFYLGAFVGYGWVNYSHYSFPENELPTKIVDQGIAPLYVFGYQISRQSALELGAIYFRKPIFKHLHQGPNNGRFKNNVVYFALKLNFMFSKSYGGFVKLGVGYVVRDFIIDQNVLIVNGKKIVRPVYGMGMDVRVSENWQMICEWMSAAKSSHNALPSSNFIGVGVVYLFL